MRRSPPSPSPYAVPKRPPHLEGTFTFAPDEEPTKPQGIEYRAAMHLRAWRNCSASDRAWLERVVDLMAWARER